MSTDSPIRIVRGNPDDDELAALIAVLQALPRSSVRKSDSGNNTASASWTRTHQYVSPTAWTARDGRHLGE